MVYIVLRLGGQGPNHLSERGEWGGPPARPANMYALVAVSKGIVFQVEFNGNLDKLHDLAETADFNPDEDDITIWNDEGQIVYRREVSPGYDKKESYSWPIEIAKVDCNQGYALGNRTVREIYTELCERLRAEGFWPDEYFQIDNWDFRPDDEIPDYHWIACFPVTGGSEGWYVHVELIIGDRHRLLFLGKTFQGIGRAAEIATACARHLGA